MDIVERLSEYNPPESVNDKMMQEIAIDIQDAKNEIERLREALQFYARWGVVSPWCDKIIQEKGGIIARSALQQKETE